MANMSYCRFQNTAGDLIDCTEHMDDGDLSDDEKKARTSLIKSCVEIALSFGHEVGQDLDFID